MSEAEMPLRRERGTERPPLLRRLARTALAIAPRETSFATRGFRWDTEEIRLRLEGIGACFVRGYHAALETGSPEIATILDREEPFWRGFAYEGAAMGMTLLDLLTFWRQDHLRRFLAGPGDAHPYIIHVGAGWVLGRVPIAPSSLLARLDPVLGWLALDGYGFHEGFFHARTAIARQQVPRKVSGYARRGFDQGLGRSLWFVEGAGVERIAATIAAFPPERRRDLWSGVGLACCYAGGVPRVRVEELRRAAGSCLPDLAQGAAFAAEARERAGHTPDSTELACEVLCGASAAAVAAVARETARDLPPDGEVPAFEAWRRRLQSHFSNGGAG